LEKADSCSRLLSTPIVLMNLENVLFKNIYFHFLLIKSFFDFLPGLPLDLNTNYHSQPKHSYQLWMTAYDREPKVFHTYIADGIMANGRYIKKI